VDDLSGDLGRPAGGDHDCGYLGYAPALFLAGGLRCAGALLFTLLQVGIIGAAAKKSTPLRFRFARHRKA
jgi:hypothetical protein